MATELSTILLQIDLIELPRQSELSRYQVLLMLTECSLSLDCLHRLATCFKFRLLIALMYVVKRLILLSIHQLHRVRVDY